MPRSEILDLMSELKLFGMKAVSAHGLLHLNNPPFIARTIVEHLGAMREASDAATWLECALVMRRRTMGKMRPDSWSMRLVDRDSAAHEPLFLPPVLERGRREKADGAE
jgi:hypothetical protein